MDLVQKDPLHTSVSDTPAFSTTELHQAADPMAYITSSSGSRGDQGLAQGAQPVVELATTWGPTLLEVKSLGDPRLRVILGSAEHPLPLELFPFSEPFELLSLEGQDLVLRYLEGWRGSLHLDGRVVSLEELVLLGRAQAEDGGVFRVTLRLEEQAVIDVGPLTYLARRTRPGARSPKADKRVDLPFVGTIAFAAFAAFMFGIVAVTSPPPPGNELIDVRDRFANAIYQVPEKAPEKINKVPKPKQMEEGKRAQRQEGRRGAEDAKMEQARGGNLDKRQLDKQFAEEAGVLGALSRMGQESGLGDPSLNPQLLAGLGGTTGAQGVQIGTKGLGERGPGFGGGGNALHGQGLGLEGWGRDARTQAGELASSGVKPASVLPQTDSGIILGGLDKSQIDSAIKRHLNQFKYCYQRELTKDPTLGGKVTLKFTITGSGEVSAAQVKNSSLGSDAVHQCLSNTMMRIQFPEPKGNGIVIVSYPFLFAPG
jgi:hypothetical protein